MIYLIQLMYRMKYIQVAPHTQSTIEQLIVYYFSFKKKRKKFIKTALYSRLLVEEIF